MTTTGVLKSSILSAPGSLVVTTGDGKDHSFTLDAQSKVTLEGQPSTLGALSPGVNVSVVSDGDKVKRVDAKA